jgi:hypothetical protein
MADLLDRLEQESAALPSKQRTPTMNPMSAWLSRMKSQDQFDQDQRAAYVLSKLSERSPGATAFQHLPPTLAKQVIAYERDPEQWTSSYKPAAGNYPIYNAAMWAQSLPSAIYATGKMAANSVDKAIYQAMTGDEEKNDVHPEAYDQYQHSANTFTGGVLDPSGPSHWRDVVDTEIEQQRAPRLGYLPGHTLDQRIADTNHAQNQEIEEGRAFLNRMGSNPYVSNVLGPVLDAGLSWPSSIGPAAQAIRAGKPLAALTEFAGDVAMANPNVFTGAWDQYWKGKLPWEE